MFLSTQSFAPTYGWSLLPSIFAGSTIPGRVLVSGTLTVLSEFGTADRRVDFYIPSKKWAVELLCNGQRLE